MGEWVDVVDADDRVVGRTTRAEMRRRNLPHRAVYVLVLSSRNELFVRGQTDTASGLFADFDTGLAFTPGNSFVLRVQLQGASPTTIRVKAWRLGTSEPAAWSLTTTTSSGPQTAGSLGIRTVNTSTTTSTLPFDNLLATRIG